MKPRETYLPSISMFVTVLLTVTAALLAGCGNGFFDANTLDALQGVLGSQSDNAVKTTPVNPVDDRGGTRADAVSDDPPDDDHGGQSNDDVAGDDSGATGEDDSEQDDNKGGNSELRFQAQLDSDTAAKGNADYRVGDGGRRKFKVEVEHFPPGEYEIRINDRTVAKIVGGASGWGEIEFDSKVESGHQPFPNNFPAEIRAGDRVSVGGLVSGKF